MKKSVKAVAILTLLLVSCGAIQANRPKLVVNIVVSQMGQEHLEKFLPNFSNRGFYYLMERGVYCENAQYNYMNTTTYSGLATITTGANPSTHGVVSKFWIDHSTGQREYLIKDPSVRGIEYNVGDGEYSGKNLIVPTFGDMLKWDNAESRSITIALDPTSAIVMGGMTSQVYWMDDAHGTWATSSAYMSKLPNWVGEYNSLNIADGYSRYQWLLSQDGYKYFNKRYSVIEPPSRAFLQKVNVDGSSRMKASKYAELLTTPVGNEFVVEFAKFAIQNEELGRDEHPDILNICFDSPRWIAEVYGERSLEFEDGLYQLDRQIGELINFLEINVDMKKTIIVLTSDHGMVDTQKSGEVKSFNVAQFEVLINGFINTQFGTGEWVLDYSDKQLYLNRDLAYQKGISIEDIQKRAAAFALQFRGVSHVITFDAMQNSYFGGGYGEKMQNSFYPKRAGDIMLNFMPGWIELQQGVVASSGSLYKYDTHVPLIIFNPWVGGKTISREVDIIDIAPTLSEILKISRPIATEGRVILEAVE